VLVVSTSNLAKAIDSAFVDRADIVQYIDLPPPEAIYVILRSCLVELITKGVVAHSEVPSLEEARYFERTTVDVGADHSTTASPCPRQIAVHLFRISQKCREQKMSGRTLRRLPVLAHARYISLGYALPPNFAVVDPAGQKAVNGTNVSNTPGPEGWGTPVEMWLNAVEKVVETHAGELKRFEP